MTQSLTVSEQLEEMPELLPLSPVATQLIQSCQDANASLRDLSEHIERDPALSVKLLRVANSALYGFPGEIRTVDHAAVVLGFREVKNMTMSVVAGQAFTSGKSAAKEREALWEHSLGCAAVARILAKDIADVESDEVFLAGVVHDLGKLVFLDLVPDEYVRMHAETDSADLVKVETELFGICHQEVGNRCAEDWGLPSEIIDSISFHHCPETVEFDQEFIGVVALANRLSKIWKLGNWGVYNAQIEDILDPNLGLTLDHVLSVEQACREAYETLLGATK